MESTVEITRAMTGAMILARWQTLGPKRAIRSTTTAQVTPLNSD
jgi:hypothetical protein